MFSFTIKRFISSLFLTISLSSVLFALPFSPSTNKINVSSAQGVQNNLATIQETVKFDCNLLSWGGISNCLLRFEYWLLVSFPAWLFHLASYLFDALWAFALSSATYRQDDFINVGWVICRDVANTFFIFVLLYIAIGTILQLGGVSTKQLLSTLIVVALFLNFSMYITRFVVDVGNIFALEFYSTFPAYGPGGPPVNIPGINQRSIGNGFNHALITPLNNIINVLGTQNGFALKAAIIALTGIMFLVAAFIFLISAFLLLGRVVAIWILMIVSPLAFFSKILPRFSGVWSNWVKNLIDQTFFPAIFLFFIYLAARLANANGWLMDLFAVPNIGPGTVIDAHVFLIVFLRFATVIFFLMFGLKKAKEGAGAAGAIAASVGGTVVLGGAAIAGRQFIGRAANWAQNTETAKQLAAKSKVARFALNNTVGRAATGNWDARSSIIGSKVAGGALGTVSAGQGGFAAAQQKSQQAQKSGYDALRGDTKKQAQYVASLQKFGALDIKGKEMGRINPDRDSKALWSKLSVRERQDLIEASKGTKDEAYLKKLNTSLTEESAYGTNLFTPTQKKDEVKAQYDLLKDDPKAGVVFAEGLATSGNRTQFNAFLKQLPQKDVKRFEEKMSSPEAKKILAEENEKIFNEAKPLQQEVIMKERYDLLKDNPPAKVDYVENLVKGGKITQVASLQGTLSEKEKEGIYKKVSPEALEVLKKEDEKWFEKLEPLKKEAVIKERYDLNKHDPKAQVNFAEGLIASGNADQIPALLEKLSSAEERLNIAENASAENKETLRKMNAEVVSKFTPEQREKEERAGVEFLAMKTYKTNLENYTKETKEDLKKTYEEELGKSVKKLTTKQVTNLPTKELLQPEVVGNLKPRHLAAVKKMGEGKFTSEEMDLLDKIYKQNPDIDLNPVDEAKNKKTKNKKTKKAGVEEVEETEPKIQPVTGSEEAAIKSAREANKTRPSS